ncbi:MAG TPA: polyribonucleotide nucleotidyltransferase [Candidatus Fermentibacter daniensis]|nr:polyribonucleotide nucleotidyltransferase [Candidatus Fermentibacter daniensis]
MPFKVETTVAGRTLSIETGRLAKQADGAALVRYGDSVVLTAAVSEKQAKPGQGFFPLTVDYRERTYAAGKIPGGFFKREGKPSEAEVLAARLIDRPIRPLFPEGYACETQVYCIVISSDSENDPDLLGMLGASASLMVSDIPWNGPVSAVRVGRIGDRFIVNPTIPELAQTDLDIVVAVRGNDVVMLEGGCSQVPEKVVIEAIELARTEGMRLNALQTELAKQVGRAKREFTPVSVPDGLYEAVEAVALPEFDGVYGHGRKEMWGEAEDRARAGAAGLAAEYGFDSDDAAWVSLLDGILEKIEKAYVRKRLAVDKVRFDGRAPDQIRNIECEVGIIPRAHGSAVFTRGQTQALVAATLGGDSDEQRIDAITGEYTKRFMLHYNFPSFSVGEVKPIRGPGRREIGHGHLAERSIQGVMPDEESFPYTVRVVSDILESNGSSSMATVCGGTLCLMDAGVPIKAPVAGVALGLAKHGNDYTVLTDIAGVEDHLGEMDFKIAGTMNGVTAVQMDLKIEGISTAMLTEAFEKARIGREHILKIMLGTIPTHRDELSPYAPRVSTVRINPDKIGKLIGPGGKMIRSIQEEAGVKIDICDDGTVRVLSTDSDAAAKALKMVDDIVGVPQVGKIYEGTVSTVAKFGAFVEIMPGTDGLVHVSEISRERVNEVSDVLKKGDRVRVKVLEIRDDGKINLSMKRVDEDGAGDSGRS